MTQAKLNFGIIGGGASGVICAITLLRKFGRSADITIFEPSPQLALGLAYGTDSAALLLNVAMNRMGVMEDPLDFQKWCEQKHPEVAHAVHRPFMPRFIFGEYLRERLSELETSSGKKITHCREKVKSVEQNSSEWIVTAEKAYTFTHLVVATGYNSNVPPFKSLENVAAHILQPQLKVLAQIDKNASLLIFGTGLTAIDCRWLLREQGHHGKITFTSRHGHFPLTTVGVSEEQVNLPELFRFAPARVLREIRALNKKGISFSRIADSVRAQVPLIWREWSAQEREQFVRHMKTYWDVIRHRVPKTMWDEIAQELREHKTELVKGRVASAELKNQKAHVIVRSANKENEIVVDKIILATGHSIDQNAVQISLEGIEKSNLGWRNKSAKKIWFIGPCGKIANWETTAVPDIFSQAKTMVHDVTSEAEL